MNRFCHHLADRAEPRRPTARLRIDALEDRSTPALTGLRGMFLLSSSYFPHTGIAPVVHTPVAATPVRTATPVLHTPVTTATTTGGGLGTTTGTTTGSGLGTTGIGAAGTGTGLGTVTVPGTGTAGLGTTTGTGLGTTTGTPPTSPGCGPR